MKSSRYRHDAMLEWDPAKRLGNLEKHGLDFVAADRLFDGRPAVDVPARRLDEDRVVTTAELDGLLVTVVWTWRGSRRRIISFRRARHEERDRYVALLGR